MQPYELLQQLVTDNCYSEQSINDLFDHWYNDVTSQLLLYKGNLYNVTIERENLFIGLIKFCLRIPRKAYKISVSPVAN
jgi:hypothetical protein